MPWKIVQTTENSQLVLTVVPAAWEQKGTLRWPKGRQVMKLLDDETSIPGVNWEAIPCVMKRLFLTKETAIAEIETMESADDTELEGDHAGPNKMSPIDEIDVNNMLSTENTGNDFNSNGTGHSNEHAGKNPGCKTVPSPGSVTETAQKDLHEVSNTEISLPDQDILFDVDKLIREGVLTITPPRNDPEKVGRIQQNESLTDSEKLDVIIKNQEEIVSNQRRIMQAIANNEAFVQILAHRNATQPEPSQMPKEKPFRTPLSTEEEILQMEQLLSSNAEMERHVDALKNVCGIRGKENGADCCYRLVDIMFTREIICRMSWTGATRQGPSESLDPEEDFNSEDRIGKSNELPNIPVEEGTSSEVRSSAQPHVEHKISLQRLKNIRLLFFNIILLADNEFSEVACERFFKTILKNQKARLNSAGVTSGHKNRPKSLRYKNSKAKSKDDSKTG